MEAERDDARKAIKVGDFLRLGGAAHGDAAQPIHDHLLAAFVVRSSLRGHPFRKYNGGLGLDPAWGDAQHANSLGYDLSCQGLAIGRERPLGRGVGDGGLMQGQHALYGTDVNDDPRALSQHRRQQCTIEAYGGHQVQVELGEPVLITERRESPARSSRAAERIDQDVRTAPLPQDRLGQVIRAVRSRQVGGNVRDPVYWLRRDGARGSDHAGSGHGQGLHDCGAKAQRPAGNHCAQATQVEVEAHAVISSREIRSRSRRSVLTVRACTWNSLV